MKRTGNYCTIRMEIIEYDENGNAVRTSVAQRDVSNHQVDEVVSTTWLDEIDLLKYHAREVAEACVSEVSRQH